MLKVNQQNYQKKVFMMDGEIKRTPKVTIHWTSQRSQCNFFPPTLIRQIHKIAQKIIVTSHHQIKSSVLHSHSHNISSFSTFKVKTVGQISRVKSTPDQLLGLIEQPLMVPVIGCITDRIDGREKLWSTTIFRESSITKFSNPIILVSTSREIMNSINIISATRDQDIKFSVSMSYLGVKTRRIYRGAVNLILFRHCQSKIFWNCTIWNINIHYKNGWNTLQKWT